MSKSVHMKTKISAINFEENSEVFSVNGHNCFALNVSNHLTKGLDAIRFILNDLGRCRECVSYLLNVDDDREHNGLIVWAMTKALIITYGKCFASAKERATSLNRKNVPKEFLDTHDYFIKLRNDFVAHSSGSGEYAQSLIALSPNKSDMRVAGVCPSFVAKLRKPNNERLVQLGHLIPRLEELLREKKVKSLRALFDWVSHLDVEPLYDYFKEVGSDESVKLGHGDFSYDVEILPDSQMRVKGLIK